MLELLERVVLLHWQRSGARLRHLKVAGSRVWFADFPARPGRFHARRRAPTLVLLHGLGASAVSFHAVIAGLRRRYRVIVPDLPGCGRSRPPRRRAFLPFAEHVDVVERFVARVAPRGAYLAGNSMGGWMAAKVAARRPELVHGIGLLNPGGPALQAEDWEDFARVVMGEQPDAVDEWMVRVFHRPPLLMRLLKRDLRRWLRGPPVTRLMTTLQAEDFLTEEEAAGVRCPAVLVWGERDRLIPAGCRTFYVRHVPNLRYEPVPDCGHCPQVECPGRTADLLVELAGAERPAAAAPAAGFHPALGRRGGVRAAARA